MRAFAYKMKSEAMKRQGFRTDLTSSQVVTKLTISFIGYESVTVPAKANMRVTLSDNSTMLGEVQVVAYGVQKKVRVIC